VKLMGLKVQKNKLLKKAEKDRKNKGQRKKGRVR
jgi:hypothetical protein